MKAACGLFCVVLVLAGRAPAVAATFLPPSTFDRPFQGTLRIVSLPYWKVSHGCGVNPGGGHRAEACAIRAKDSCLVVLPEVQEIGEAEAARLLRHEIAHCNGWPRHHPSARF
jgi:hypothetical protein